MEYLERKTLPNDCLNCTEPECDVCDIALDRWYLPNDLELRLKIKGLQMARERMRRQSLPYGDIEDQIVQIEEKLLPFTGEQINAIEHRTHMTKTIFDACIEICTLGQDEEMLDALCQYFPHFVDDSIKKHRLQKNLR